MKSQLLGLLHEASTAESVYAEKYEWLMRWALHFCDGDREMAEDLVQDTFVRMLSSWSSIRDLENPERFLYTYLKYGYLRLRSANNKKAIQSVCVEDLDLIDYQFLGTGPNLQEWQQSIRAIVMFLCWRKTTAKSASLLLLRFFHGLFPAELMRVARLTRKAVDDGLASARQEARSCDGQPGALSSVATPRPSRSTPFLVVSNGDSQLSTEEFMRQMLALIFAASNGDCLSAEALRNRYDTRSTAAIDCWLLSHIVSCQRCLDLVLDLQSLPPRGTRPLEDILGYAPKTESAKATRKAPISAAMQSILAGRERYRRVIAHRPHTIALVVDGQSLASRDVSSAQSKLTVDLRAAGLPDLVEVTGDSFLLIAVPVFAYSPNSDPVQHFHTQLTDGRSVDLTLEFNPLGVSIHLIYVDPLMVEATAPLSLPSDQTGLLHASEEASGTESMMRLGPDFGWLKKIFRPWFGLSLAFTCAGLIIAHSFPYANKPVPAAILAHAVEAAQQVTAGIATQRVRIATVSPHVHSSYETTLHRDLSHRLTAKRAPESKTHSDTEQELAAAKIAWNDPLSPANFREWREQHHDASDTLIEQRDGSLTLKSTVGSGLVREQSLTVNAVNFHAVARTVRFRDDEEIQIAELDYSVVPLAMGNPAWFEASASEASKSRPRLSPRPLSVATPLSEVELDIAELNVRLAMVELQADGRERLSISRRPDAVTVQGIVATDERRRGIERRLRQVANVRSDIKTFAEADVTQHPRISATSAPNSALTVMSALDNQSPLETLAQQRRLSNERTGALHAALLDSAIELRQSAVGIREIETRFGGHRLDADASTLRSALFDRYTARMRAAAENELRTLIELGIATSDRPTQIDFSPRDAAMANAALCFELISSQTDTPRPAETILHELATSAHAMQQTLRRTFPQSAQQAEPAL